MKSRRVLGTLLALLALLVVAACGVGIDDEARPIDVQTVPFGLLDAAPATTATTIGDGFSEAVSIFVTTTGPGGSPRLAPVTREVPTPETVGRLLTALFEQPPNESERQQGLSSAIPSDTRLLDQPRVSGDVVSVNLSSGVLGLQGDRQRLAFAQVVWTATSIEGVHRVRFLVEGEAQAAIVADGEARAEPVGRSDYATLAPRD